MTKGELDEKIKLVLLDAERKKKELIKEFCIANNPYKVGDIFEDNIGKIKILKILFSSQHITGNPCCVYVGQELKQNGTQKKTYKERTAYQSNDIKIKNSKKGG
jgi:hypothetical protein